MRSRLPKDGIERAVVEGIWLEGQFALGDGRLLLLTSCDTPWQGSVHLIVLGEEFVLLDHCVIWTLTGDSFVEGVAFEHEELSFSTHGHRFEVRVRASLGLVLLAAGTERPATRAAVRPPTHRAVRPCAETERRQGAEP